MICRWSNKTKRFEPEPQSGDTLLFPAGSRCQGDVLERLNRLTLDGFNVIIVEPNIDTLIGSAE